ncbi:4'-phosphopantetheinyl transferase family protein [Marinomonas mediterranea]|jgi:Phosphopantetheinyl transferase component of siderophore synthetase|uniref:Enterobactin synthase component D n=1 Tax=Marinomonas mediterranea (strain ATCC 700492 / JCM 21426 / NBRC 103028 / MMB-1) TaxID=717774 RepID=F2JZ71_MARM1|nr:4'-phosphopantetheinyl transferase superfamily protein [Marinomonas mediterranea]ADZ92049.1 4'-phosphopantetheinyl transferase [Marinomonas mediterranea MMB-1]WCN10015.1 4'-phosphopantetheinyl transferase superfamily protein [Marinomonas mediterranea]WCN18121.1 4'-phosphopantetheinyl transferase superfamily protein [Marinomonas mediterranea MMB-1]
MTTVSYLPLKNAGISIPVSYFPFQTALLREYETSFFGQLPADYGKWVAKRKVSFLAGRLAVQQLLTHLDLPNMAVLKAEDGSPIWPNGWKGSIAHANDQAIASVLPAQSVAESRLQGLGLDVENLDKTEIVLETQKMIAVEREVSLLESVGYDKAVALLMIFSIKESVFKAVYPKYGVYFDFLDAELVSVNRSEEWEVRLTRTLSETFPAGFPLTVKAWVEESRVYSYCYWL